MSVKDHVSDWSYRSQQFWQRHRLSFFCPLDPFLNAICSIVSLITWLIPSSVFPSSTKWLLTVSTFHPLLWQMCFNSCSRISAWVAPMGWSLLLRQRTCWYSLGFLPLTWPVARYQFHLTLFSGERYFLRHSGFPLWKLPHIAQSILRGAWGRDASQMGLSRTFSLWCSQPCPSCLRAAAPMCTICTRCPLLGSCENRNHDLLLAGHSACQLYCWD